MGWQSTRLKREFNNNPWLADRLSFDSGPSQSRLWEGYEDCSARSTALFIQPIC